MTQMWPIYKCSCQFVYVRAERTVNQGEDENPTTAIGRWGIIKHSKGGWEFWCPRCGERATC